MYLFPLTGFNGAVKMTVKNWGCRELVAEMPGLISEFFETDKKNEFLHSVLDFYPGIPVSSSRPCFIQSLIAP